MNEENKRGIAHGSIIGCVLSEYIPIKEPFLLDNVLDLDELIPLYVERCEWGYAKRNYCHVVWEL